MPVSGIGGSWSSQQPENVQGPQGAPKGNFKSEKPPAPSIDDVKAAWDKIKQEMAEGKHPSIGEINDLTNTIKDVLKKGALSEDQKTMLNDVLDKFSTGGMGGIFAGLKALQDYFG